ncbi:MAG TPA: recombination mediator RecR [Anaeromyxobacteraceae bacterium]|nr:recombination mediator RecR [Anaeromyxobacteraceae bacterium]
MSALDDLVTEFARLPGIGRKTAQRLAFHLLQQPSAQLERLAETLRTVGERIRPCEECGNLAEGDRCEICRDPRRDPSVVCVVEEPATILAVERSGGFRGRYQVLGGRLAPLEGIGPDQLRTGPLMEQVKGGAVREVILATNPSIEGEATASWLAELLAGTGVKVTRLARGLPLGGDLDYVDGVTLAHALSARQEV